MINQREVYEVNFRFPDGAVKPHPVVVLSIPDVINCEQTFIGVPISHSAEWLSNEYSFPIFDTDFDRPLKYPDSHIRIHLITVLRVNQMTDRRLLLTMKQASFNRLLDQIQEDIFGCT